MTKEEVTSLSRTEDWQSHGQICLWRSSLTLCPGYRSRYIEKPNSVFKKKEAIQVAQAIGQFASSAPMTSMKVALRVLEQAFTEVVIKPEDWDLMEKEMEMNMAGVTLQVLLLLRNRVRMVHLPEERLPVGLQVRVPLLLEVFLPSLANLPPEIKQHVEQMHQQGAPPQEIAMFLKAAVQKLQGAGGPPGGGGAPNTPPSPGAPPGGPPPGGPPHPMMQ